MRHKHKNSSDPPALSAHVPRVVSYTAAGRALWLLILAMLVGAAGALVWLPLSIEGGRERAARLETEGLDARATVISIEPRRGENKRRRLVYRYEAGGRTWERRLRLRRRDTRPVSVGSVVPVRYLPESPESAWVTGYEPAPAPWLLAVIVPAALLAAALGLAVTLTRQRRLLEEGRAAQARVVGSKKISTQYSSSYQVEYEFRLLSGATRRVKTSASKQPQEQGTVTVLYDRENPRRLTVYPLSLVRLAGDHKSFKPL
jgi:hypothetical protein